MDVIGNREGEEYSPMKVVIFYSPRHKALSRGA